MDLIQAVKCKHCNTLKEPFKGLLVEKLHINALQGAMDKQTTKVIITEEVFFCDVSCLTAYLIGELDEILF